MKRIRLLHLLHYSNVTRNLLILKKSTDIYIYKEKQEQKKRNGVRSQASKLGKTGSKKINVAL